MPPINFNHQNPFHLDGNTQIFFNRQLEYIIKELFNVEYAELKDRALIPVSFEIPSGAKTYTYRQYDKVGMAKVVHSYANDFPRVDVLGKEFTAKIESLGDSYGYNVQEIRAAALTGMNLEMQRASAAKEAMMQLENQIAFFGLSANGLNGLLSDPNVPNAAVDADGNNNGNPATEWIYKSPDQIIRDVRDARSDMIDLTKGRETPNTLVLPVTQHAMISGSPRSANSDTTILTFLRQNIPDITSVEWLNELKGSGTGNTDQFILYKKDPMKLRLMIPQDFEQFQPQIKGLDYEVPCHMRVGGVAIFYPLSISKRYGI